MKGSISLSFARAACLAKFNSSTGGKFRRNRLFCLVRVCFLDTVFGASNLILMGSLGTRSSEIDDDDDESLLTGDAIAAPWHRKNDEERRNISIKRETECPKVVRCI